jgi:hypothetical protein
VQMRPANLSQVGGRSSCLSLCAIFVFLPPQPKIAACGMLYVGANTDSSFSVATTDTPECQQQQALGANGGKHSCSRCPIIYSDTEYDMLLVAEAAGAVSGSQHIQVSAEGVSGHRAIGQVGASPALWSWGNRPEKWAVAALRPASTTSISVGP